MPTSHQKDFRLIGHFSLSPLSSRTTPPLATRGGLDNFCWLQVPPKLWIAKKSKIFIKRDWQTHITVLLYRQPTEQVVNFERRTASWQQYSPQPILPPECACVCALLVMPFFRCVLNSQAEWFFNCFWPGTSKGFPVYFFGGIFMLKRFTVLLRANYRFGRMCRCWHNGEKLVK